MSVPVTAIAERLCLFLGVLGLAVVGVVYLDSFIGAEKAIAAFEQNVAAEQILVTKGKAKQDVAQQGLDDDALLKDAPLALLKIDRLDVEVPVFLGTDRLTLNRGAGLVAGTSLPGEHGNVVISAHRDSFFRPLKDIRTADLIELRTQSGMQQFQVQDIFITDPLDISVLDQTDTSALTLITCYPFHYVGFAPERYIVRAVPINKL